VREGLQAGRTPPERTSVRVGGAWGVCLCGVAAAATNWFQETWTAMLVIRNACQAGVL
jgi:hypothetical protein